MKIKVTNDFIVNKQTMNAKAFQKKENNIQLILYCRVVGEFIENNYQN